MQLGWILLFTAPVRPLFYFSVLSPLLTALFWPSFPFEASSAKYIKVTLDIFNSTALSRNLFALETSRAIRTHSSYAWRMKAKQVNRIFAFLLQGHDLKQQILMFTINYLFVFIKYKLIIREPKFKHDWLIWLSSNKHTSAINLD